MSSKRKFKRDYIILEAKDANFRYKERVLPKAFAKIEVNNEKSVVALYVENLKNVKDGYRVVAIQSDYETIDLGKIVLSEQGKGEFILNLENPDDDIKGVALLHERNVPLIGFKGSKIDNYEEILFMNEKDCEYEEIEYIEVDEDDERYSDEEVEYEYEYIEVDEDEDFSSVDSTQEDDEFEYEYQYIEIDEDDFDFENDKYSHIEDSEHIDDVKDYYKGITPLSEYVQSIYIEPTAPAERLNVTTAKSQKLPPSKPAKKQSKDSVEVKGQRINQIKQSKGDDSPNVPGALLMPRQIKKGLKYFKEVKPFVDEKTEDTRWWKIEINPTTMCGYTMPYLGYVNSLNYTMYSDIIMNSYKYRHYLFGVQYDEYNKRKNYIYAIPGNKNEQPDKGHTGFRTYEACDIRSDKLGYWLCFIDSRSRRILK